MSVDTLIFNGKLLQANRLIEGCVAFDKGKIIYVGERAFAPSAKEKINLEGHIILPGLIDAHTHLRDLELSQKEDFYTGTCSALSGGFTTVLDMPNTIPLTDNPKDFNQKLEVARSETVANIGFYGSFAKNLKYAKEMAKIGIIGFKIFTTKREPLNGDDDCAVEKALLCAKEVNLPVAFHSEDLKTIENMETKLKKLKKNSPTAFALAHPPKAESISVARILGLSMKTGTRTHFCHLSTSESIQLIKKAKKSLPVTCEVGPHHLFLSDKEVITKGGFAIVDPPLRKIRHLQALFKALLNGYIDLVASDHAPHQIKEKVSDSIWNISPGFPGLETTLPVMLTAVNQKKITLNRLVEILAEKPAEVFDLRKKGRLLNGFDADVTVIDLKKSFIIDPEKFQSKAKYSPFKNFKATGNAVKVFVAGKLVVSEGKIMTEPGSGSIILKT